MKTLVAVAVTALSVFGRPADAGVCPIPLEPTRTSFVARVWIGERGPFRFLVDTGTSITVVNSSAGAGLSSERTIEALTTTGPVKVREATAETLRAEGVEVAGLRVLIADLPEFPSHGRVDGILGMNFMVGQSIFLDVKRRCLSLGLEEVNGDRLPARTEGGRALFVVDGLKFVLDSAASFPVLSSARARQLATAEGTFELTSAAGKTAAKSGRVRTLRLGSVTLRNVDVALIDQPSLEDVLLPVRLFSSVFISADRTSVVLNGVLPGPASRPLPRLDATLRRR